jgi:hypothetical protein
MKAMNLGVSGRRRAEAGGRGGGRLNREEGDSISIFDRCMAEVGE